MSSFKYKIGDIITGKVTEIRPYGALIDFGSDIKGLLHISEMSNHFVSDIGYFCEVGRDIAVKILEINEYNYFLRVSLKQVPQEKRLKGPNKKTKRVKINQEDYDFSPLKAALPGWIEKAKGNEEDEMIKLDDCFLIKEIDLKSYVEKVKEIDANINSKKGKGNDFLGWADYPVNYDKEEFEEIKKTAKYIRENFDTLVVCGIGGSYLGARAAIEALRGLYPNDKLEIVLLAKLFPQPTFHKF